MQVKGLVHHASNKSWGGETCRAQWPLCCVQHKCCNVGHVANYKQAVVAVPCLICGRSSHVECQPLPSHALADILHAHYASLDHGLLGT